MNKRICKISGILFLLSELAVVPVALRLMLNRHLSDLSPLQTVVLSMCFGSVLLCIIMAFSALSDQNSHPKHTFLFELAVFLCCIAPMTELITRALDSADRPVLNMICNTVFYLLGMNIAYVIMLYEFLIVNADAKPLLKKVRYAASALMIADGAATVLNIFFGYFFTITEDGRYQSAPTYWLAYIPPVLIIAVIAVVAAKEMPGGKKKVTFMLFWIFAISASALQMLNDELMLQYTGYTLSILAIYMNIQCELNSGDTKQSVSESYGYES